MESFFDWLSNNPIAANLFAAVVIVLVLAFFFLAVVMIVQNRPVKVKLGPLELQSNPNKRETGGVTSDSTRSNLSRPLKQKTGDPIPDFAKNSPNPSLGGIAHVYKQMDVEELRKRIKGASRIRILQTWTPDILNNLRLEFAHAINDNQALVEVLLINPKSSAAKLRSQDQNGDTSFGSGEAQSSLRYIDRIRSECTRPDQLRVRLYDQLPSLSAYICDDKALIGFFLKKSKSILKPFLDVHGQGLLREMIDKEWDEVWDKAIPYNWQKLG